MAEEEFSFTPEGWVKIWQRGYVGFHFTVVHPVLKEFYSKLCGGRSDRRIFLPLCGKSLDMKWLAEQGHAVVGVDCVEQAAKEFFEENKVKFSVSDIPDIQDGKLYKSEDGKIEFYVCDFFKVTKDLIGEFDAVWDVGGLFAISGYDQKDKYVEHLKPLVKSGGTILLDLAEPKLKPGEKPDEWDESLYEVDVRRMFPWCSSIELIQTYDYKDIQQYLTKDPTSGDGEEHSFDAYGKVYFLIAK